MHTYTHTDLYTDILRRLEQMLAHVYITYIPVGQHKHTFSHSQCADVFRSKLYMHSKYAASLLNFCSE